MADSTTQTPKRSRSAGPPAESASLDDLVAALDAEPRERRSKRGAGAEADDSEPPIEADAEPTADDATPAAPRARAARAPTNVILSSELPLGEDDDLSAIEGEAAPRLVSIVESLLFATNKPLGVRDIRHILKDASVRQIQLALKQLGRDLEGRGVVLAQAAGGFRLRTNPENGRWVQQLLAERPAKLSRSQLESLAVVAYRQPITKPEIDHIRGVDCAAVLKVLLDYDLVRIVGRKEEPGRPHLYGTTLKFLEFFNLRSLRDMPDLHEFRELTEESRAVMREHLGESGLYDDREAMGQEVLDWTGGNDEHAPHDEAAVAGDGIAADAPSANDAPSADDAAPVDGPAETDEAVIETSDDMDESDGDAQ